MHAGLGAARECLEEILHQFSLQIPDKPHANLCFHYRRRSSAKIHCRKPQRFIHGHQEISRPQNSAFRAQRLLEELPERLAPPDWLKAWTHAEIDAGADIIVMHGAPLLHGIEIYRGRPIFFDLGNFIFQAPPIEFQPVLESNLELGERLKPLVADVTGILEQLSVEGRNVLFEGAQGAMLDVDLGTYPYVTSSTTSAGGAAAGTGLGLLRFHGVAADPAQIRHRFAGAAIGLSEMVLAARELKLLEFLMRRAGQVVTRTMLLEGVWDLHFDPQSNLIDVHISRLRQAIDRGSDRQLIHTVRGSGYVLRSED